MSEIERKIAQNGCGLIGMSQSAGQYAAQREPAQAIVDRQVDEHARELSGWAWLKKAMITLPPNEGEESALWSLLSRARRERY